MESIRSLAFSHDSGSRPFGKAWSHISRPAIHLTQSRDPWPGDTRSADTRSGTVTRHQDQQHEIRISWSRSLRSQIWYGDTQFAIRCIDWMWATLRTTRVLRSAIRWPWTRDTLSGAPRKKIISKSIIQCRVSKLSLLVTNSLLSSGLI